MTTGQKIFECRKKAGLTQEELAEKLGVTRQAVSKWESDAAFPETEKVLELCRLFSLSADELLLGKEPEERRNEPPAELGRSSSDAGKGVTWGVIDHRGKMQFEYISKKHIFGLPLIHINFGFGCRAHGIFAVGLVSVGFVSLGLISVGLLAFGVFSLGLLAFGSIAVGDVSFGGIAVGGVAIGGIAVGLFAMGGLAIGQLAIGGAAIGQYAVGDWAKGYLAVGLSKAEGAHAFLLKDGLEALAAWLNENASPRLADFLLWITGLLS